MLLKSVEHWIVIKFSGSGLTSVELGSSGRVPLFGTGPGCGASDWTEITVLAGSAGVGGGPGIVDATCFFLALLSGVLETFGFGLIFRFVSFCGGGC